MGERMVGRQKQVRGSDGRVAMLIMQPVRLARDDRRISFVV